MLETRKKLGISQTEMAEILEISRPTLIKIEKGEREMKPEEKDKFQKFLESFEDPEPQMRINIPQKNIEKFKQVFLYLLEKVGARPNIGQTVLYKLLYFIDFDYYEKYETQLMGLTYFKNTHGPVPREFKKTIDKMIEDKELEEVKSTYFSFQQTKYLPIIEPKLTLLNGQELEMIESVIKRYGNKTATEISDMSHRDTPWKSAEMKKNLEYEHAFYRPDEFSVREYEEL